MATPFDHVSAIYTNQALNYFDELDDSAQKSFSTYMVNRIISMTPDYLPIVNEFNQYYIGVTGRETYLFYSQILPKRKRYDKYVKGSKESKYDEWLIDILVSEYMISTTEAVYYLDILYSTNEGIDELQSICRKYGIDPKKMKKAKL